MLADSHVHLHAYADPAGLLRRAKAAGVVTVVGVSVDLASSRETIEIAQQHSGVVAAVGFHPVYLHSTPSRADLDTLAALAADPRVGFIGEIGLDVVEAPLDLASQSAVFRAQLDLARQLRKPVNLHVRDAIDRALSILVADGLPTAGAVWHYFTGDAALAERLVRAGLYLSVGKPVTRPENLALRAAVATIPLERLLLETDSYPLPGRATEPADLPMVAAAVAEVTGRASDEVARATTENLWAMLSSR